MAIFDVEIIETTTQQRLYSVEADSLEEAKELAIQGYSEAEEDLRSADVIGREIA